MEHLDTFLARLSPFDALDAETLHALGARAEMASFEPGDLVLIEDGPPARGLFVLRSGSLDLIHEGEVIQVIEPGECFGHPSLLTGLSPAFTVRAREPSECVILPAEDGRRVLGTAAGAEYIATTLRKRLTRTGHTVHALQDMGTTPVSAVMRPPVFASADMPARQAAARLGEPGVRALLVELSEGRLGLVGDAEIRAAAATPGGLEAPLREIAATPVTTIPIRQIAVEATVELLVAGTEQAAILDGDRVCGVLGAADLMGIEARSPMALRHAILAAQDEAELERAVARLPKLFLLLIRAGVPSGDIGRVLTLQHDAIISRLLDFSLWCRGEAPVAWTWLHLGSAGRREFTLSSDQDNALAYATPEPEPQPEAAAVVDAYFAQLGRDVTDGLARYGIGIDNNGVLASHRQWRMSKADWLRTFAECLREPDESHLIRATVAFDFRTGAGGLSVTPELTEQIRAARSAPNFMRLLARGAAGFPVALGFRGQLATEKHGEAAGRLDIKHGGIIPLVNLVRFHAFAAGVTVSPTLDRIDAAARVGGLPEEEAQALREADDVITRVRFERHAAAIEAGRPADNLVDPGELSPIARTELREALLVVRRSQRRLSGWVPGPVGS
jgi:CBS domain-containing protein